MTITFDRDLCFLDCETLGLDPAAPIWEVAAIRLHTDGTASVYECQILHQQGNWLDTLPQQFADDYRRRHDIQAAIPSGQAAREIHIITDGAIIAGSNPNFDTDRLARLMECHGITPGWHYHHLDIPSMVVGCEAGGLIAQAGAYPPIDVELPWHSSRLSSRVGVNPDDWLRHTAMGDARWCLAQWRAMTGQVVAE